MSDLIPADDELTPIAPPDDELTPIEPVNRVQVDSPLQGSAGIELAPLPRDPRRLSDPYAGQRAQYEAEQLQKENFVRQGFDFFKEPGLTDGQVNLRVAKHFGIDEDVVAKHRDELLKSYAVATADPKKWMRDFPLSARLVLEHPERANEVVNNKEVNVLLQAINKVIDFAEDANVAISEAGAQLGRATPGSAGAKKTDAEVAKPYADAQAKLGAERVERDRPKPTVEVDDAEAARIRDEGTLAIAGQRAKEAQHQLKKSELFHKLLVARTLGKPTFWIEQDIHRNEMDATPKYLGEEGWRQALSESVGTSMSTIEVAKNAVKKGGLAAGVGAAGGFVLGGLAGGPGGAVAGAGAGAKALGRFGATYGAAEQSFVLESGASYEELSKLKTNTGEPLTDEEARGGALIAASLKTGIELAELSVLMKSLGPAGAMLEGGGLAAVKEMLATNPGFRAMAKQAVKAWAAEGLEEVAQDAVDQVVGYGARSKHAGALEEGPVLNVERLKENFAGGLLGGALFGMGGLAFTASQHAMFKSREERSGVTAEAIAKLAANPATPGLASELAGAIQQKTAETGDDVTHVYLDPSAFMRFFQNDQAKADEKAVELMGEGGPKKLAESLATGTNLPVQLDLFLEKAEKDGFAKALEKDMALQASHQTPAQLEVAKKANEEWAQKIAAGEEKSETLDKLDAIEAELVAAQTHTVSEAKAAVEPLRQVFHGFAQKFGKTAEELFGKVRIQLDDGNKLLKVLRKQANVSERLSAELYEGKDTPALSNEARAQRLYIDSVSGLRNRRAWDETPRTPGRLIAAITSPDVKALNDNPEGGHDTTNELLRSIGREVGAVDPNAARGGTNFLLEVDSPEHLQKVLERLQATLPEGLVLEGAVGQDTKGALDALDARVGEKRTAGALPARGETKFDLAKLKDLKFPAGRAEERLSPELVTKAGTMSRADFFAEAYQDKLVPGILNGTAWGLIPRKAHVASIDIKGLKDINALGKDVGDRVLKLFAQVAERNDASDFDFAHLSGDEFAAQHDDPVKLKAWLDFIEAELQKNPLRIDNEKTGEVLEIEAKFRNGIGEKTYGAADRALNRAKAEEKRLRDEGKAAADQPGGSRADGEGGGGGVQAAPGRGADAAQQKYERHGAARQGFVDREVAKDADRFFADRERGFTDIAREGVDAVYRIALTKNADKSTFLHESAHVFLDLFAELASRADAPKSVVEDWATTLKWLGVDNVKGIRREHHEKWAKAFETYLAQGKYPADRLAGAFQRFRLWMMAVYKSVANVGGEVSPDIRGVFDRMLATDAEIEATKQRMGLRPLSAEILGMTPEEYAAHTDELLRATSHAAEAADFQVAKDQLRATEDWWKAARAEKKKQASERYEALPARIAQLLLQGKPAGGFLGIKVPLNRAVVETMVGKKNGAKFNLVRDGIHPDEVVEGYSFALGFGTGRDMLRAVLQLPEKDDWVSAISDEAMDAEFPGVLQERERLRELVGKGLHGKATKEWLLKEYAALNSRASQAPGEMPPAEVLKRAADIMAAGRTPGQLLPRAAQVAERTAANNAAEAAARGRFAQAAVYKRQQLLNMYLHDAIVRAKKEVEQVEAKAAQLSKLPARQRLGKASPIYRDAVASILATFDLAAAEPGETRSLDALLQEVEKLMLEDQTPVAFDRTRLVDRATTRGMRTWRELPMEDVRRVMAALQNIEAAARNRGTVLVDEKRADIEDTVEQLHREAEQLEKRPDDPTPEAATVAQNIGRRWNALDGALLKPETLARLLGGAKDTDGFLKSMWFRAIVKPMQDAKVREQDLAREHLAPLVERMEALPASTQRRQMEKVNGRKLFPNHPDLELPQRRFEILMMLLNMGNQGNIDRLTRGRNISETEVMNAADAVGVTKEEWDWVQSVWDTAEQLKPLAFDLEEKHTGVRPDAVVARPLETPFGELRGGYFPAVYSAASSTGARQEAQLAQSRDPEMARPSTTRNFLKSRVEDFSDLISLSPATINRHFALVIHDVAFREAVQSVGALLTREDVRQTLRERVGDGRGKQLLQWVGDVAQMRGLEGMDKSGGLMRLATAMRGNLITATLGYKLPNALEDFTTNLTSAIPASDLKPQHLSAGLWEFTKAPFESRAMALQKSGELRAREKQTQRELAKQVQNLHATKLGRLLSSGPMGWYKDHAFAFAEYVEKATATPIWIGAFRQALAAEKTEAEAVTFADATLRQVLVSHNTVDLSALMRDKGPIGYLTMFMGAFNHFYNQFRQLGHGYAQADTIKERAVKAGKMAGLATGIFLIGSLARGHGPGPGEEKEQWLLRKLFLEGLMQMVPGANVVGSAMSQHLQGKRVTARNNSVYGLAEGMADSVLKVAEGGGSARDVMNLLGPATGLPLAGPMASADYLDKLSTWVLGAGDLVEGQPRP